MNSKISMNSISPSTLDLQTLITSNDIQTNIENFNKLVETAKNYRNALCLISDAASEFGSALEEVAKTKGSHNSGEGLMNAAGLQFLIANHDQILSKSIKQNFEIPIREKINDFKKDAILNDLKFKQLIREKLINLKKREKEINKFSKLKTKNLMTYKTNLLSLTSQLDEIDKLKHDFYLSSFELVQDFSQEILNHSGLVVRSQLEISEAIAKKGWSGGGLENLIANYGDPFSGLLD
ncbi:hypothetical protein PACTADRAFT_42261, partial [Pachysolen tannophilus NRRL Y-2460]